MNHKGKRLRCPVVWLLFTLSSRPGRFRSIGGGSVNRGGGWLNGGGGCGGNRAHGGGWLNNRGGGCWLNRRW